MGGAGFGEAGRAARMTGIDPTDERAALTHIRALAVIGAFRVSTHVRRYLSQRATATDEIVEALLAAGILENYPAYFKGPCALLNGSTRAGRPLHIVCSTTLPEVVLISVYEPTPPKWTTPTERG